MDKEQIESLIRSALELDELHVKTVDSHAEVIAVGEMFTGLSRVKKQQAIYQPLMAHIQDGTLHAVSIKAFSPEEWAREKKFILPS